MRATSHPSPSCSRITFKSMRSVSLLFKKENATSLDLCARNLPFLPFSKIASPEIRRIDLSENYLSTLPSDIKHLTKLEQLNLATNIFTTLPYSLSVSFAFLQNLAVRFEDFSSTTKSLHSLYKLTGIKCFTQQALATARGDRKLAVFERFQFTPQLSERPPWIFLQTHFSKFLIFPTTSSPPSLVQLMVALYGRNSTTFEY